jgi:hypothetical protein
MEYDSEEDIYRNVVGSNKEEGEEEEEKPKVANPKRTLSDQSDAEPESKRESRRTKVQKCTSEDVILQDTMPVFAFLQRAFHDEVTVFQSDLETIKRLLKEQKVNIEGIPGYLATDAQIIRLIHLYKFKRVSRDGEKVKAYKLREMKESTLALSWKAMIDRLREGSYEYEKFCSRKENLRDLLGNHAQGLKKRVHDACQYKLDVCFVWKSEGKCTECTKAGVSYTQDDLKSFKMDYREFDLDEQKTITQYEKVMSRQKTKASKEAKEAANASPHTQRVLRGYLPAEQNAEAKSPAWKSSQASERDTESHATSYDYDSSTDDPRYDRRSSARRRENPRGVEAQDAGKSEWDRSKTSDDRMSYDLDRAWQRIRDLEYRLWELENKRPVSSSATSVASQQPAASSVSTDVEVRLCRLETSIAQTAKESSESREKLSQRVTEAQAALLRFDSRYEILDGRTTKIVQGQQELEKKRQAQRVKLEVLVENAESLSRSLTRQKKAIAELLDLLVEKTKELPAVVSFHDSQGREKMLGAIQKARHGDDSA